MIRVVKRSSGKVYEVVGVNKSRKKLVFRINEQYGGTNPLGGHFEPADYRDWDSATPEQRSTAVRLNQEAADLQAQIENLNSALRKVQGERRSLIDGLRQIDTHALPGLELLDRKSSRSVDGMGAFDRADWDTPDSFRISHLVKL